MPPALVLVESPEPAPPVHSICSVVPRSPPSWERRIIRVGDAATSLRNLRGFGATAALAVILWLVGAPWLVPWVFMAGIAHYSAAVAAGSVRAARDEHARGPLAYPLLPEVEPREIASQELRSTYEGILRLHEDIRSSLVAATRMQSVLRSVFERCGEVVQVAGRLARLANPLDRYLGAHVATQVTDAVQRLSSTAGDTGDVTARTVYESAAAARGRQLATLVEIQALRERIRARLTLIAASLESVSALIIKLQVLDLEQIALAGDSMSEQLGSLADELGVLESTMQATIE